MDATDRQTARDTEPDMEGPAGPERDTRPEAGSDLGAGARPEAEQDPGPAIPPPRLGLSPAAVEEIRGMLEDEDIVEHGGLRIRARSGAGCSAPLQYGLLLEPEPDEDDVVLEGKGIRIFMDPTSAWSLDGLFVDWVDDPELGEGFAFRHPRGAGGRAC